MTEAQSKVKLINHFTDNLTDKSLIIVQELPFLEYKRRADIVFLINEKTYAIEIKTVNDNITNVKSQVNDYKKIFDFCFIASEGNNLKKLQKDSFGNIGLIDLSNDNIVTRNAIQNKRLSKESLLSSLPIDAIISHTNRRCNTKSETVKLMSKSLNIEECRKIFIEYITNRYKHTSNIFFDEIGDSLNTDDLLLLNLDSKVIY